MHASVFLRTLLVLCAEQRQTVAHVIKKAGEWFKDLVFPWSKQVEGAGLGADLPECVNVSVPALGRVLVSAHHLYPWDLHVASGKGKPRCCPTAGMDVILGFGICSPNMVFNLLTCPVLG